MRPLIQNQRIRCDAHDAGSGQPVKWDAVHIDKEFIDGTKRRGARIIVPIGKDKEIEVRGRNISESEFTRIKKEITEALKSLDKRQKFIEDIGREISRFAKGRATIEEARAGAKRIANHFGLNDEIIGEISAVIDRRLTTFMSFHRDKVTPQLYQIRITGKYVYVGPKVYKWVSLQVSI